MENMEGSNQGNQGGRQKARTTLSNYDPTSEKEGGAGAGVDGGAGRTGGAGGKAGKVEKEVTIYTVHNYQVCSAKAKEKKTQYWLKERNSAFGGKMRLGTHEVAFSAGEAIQKELDDALLQFNRAKERFEMAQRHLEKMKDMVEEHKEALAMLDEI